MVDPQIAAYRPPLIEMTGVSYCQPNARIVVDATWRVETGQHWAILGPNGSGKSTLLKIATGYLWHTGGTVRRLGDELIDLGALRRNIGWISSDIAALVPASETALETVVSGKYAQFGLRLLESTTPTLDDLELADAELRRLGCESLAAKQFGILSQGERQQVLVARTRMAGSTLLVLDEPCAGMDPGVRERYLAWLQGRLTDPTFPTLLMATHHLEEIVAGVGHALLMRDGRIERAGLVDEVINAEAIERLYEVQVARIEKSGGRWWPIWA